LSNDFLKFKLKFANKIEKHQVFPHTKMLQYSNEEKGRFE